jgi:hypothetical protein
MRVFKVGQAGARRCYVRAHLPLLFGKSHPKSGLEREAVPARDRMQDEEVSLAHRSKLAGRLLWQDAHQQPFNLDIRKQPLDAALDPEQPLGRVKSRIAVSERPFKMLGPQATAPELRPASTGARE